jgi:hypothetical protein
MSTNIYFIKNTITHNFKIGKANEPIKRLKQLQTGNEAKLEIYVSIPTSNLKLETLLHGYFKTSKLQGEWFKITDSDVDQIILLVNQKDNFDNMNIRELRLVAKINNINANLKKADIIFALNKKFSSDESEEEDITEFKSGCIII